VTMTTTMRQMWYRWGGHLFGSILIAMFTLIVFPWLVRARPILPAGLVAWTHRVLLVTVMILWGIAVVLFHSAGSLPPRTSNGRARPAEIPGKTYRGWQRVLIGWTCLEVGVLIACLDWIFTRTYTVLVPGLVLCWGSFLYWNPHHFRRDEDRQ